LQEGVEENNEFTSNMASLIHFMGMPTGDYSTSYNNGTVGGLNVASLRPLRLSLNSRP